MGIAFSTPYGRVVDSYDVAIECVRVIERCASPNEGSRTYRECISSVAPGINMYPVEYSDIKSVGNTWCASKHIRHPRISTGFMEM